VIRITKIYLVNVVLALFTLLPGLVLAQGVPDLSGMWSDPPPRAEDAFCHVGCTVEARDYLTQLLDDPANLERSYAELRAQAQQFQANEFIPSHLSAVALKQYPYRRNSNPNFTVCSPWGFTRQILAPHAMELKQYEDRVTLYYSEWTARRTVYLDGREPPADLESSLLGYSVGYYEGDTLVVETTGMTANYSNANFAHSDQLTSTERFTRTNDGDRLDVVATLEDPVMFVKPLVMARAWSWAPTEEIYPYEDCLLSGEQ
jgi:hypothetical protein